jgi:3-isopropylmalate/(R)-2-methylmalate dehydratase small subunit
MNSENKGTIISGPVWKFGDNINTDLMLPGDVHAGTEAEQARAVFAANRPGWVDEMKTGDVIIGGRNYGTGSSRPAARSLKNIGIACLVADSLNGLFFRNCVNFGLLALECAGVSELFSEEGQIAQVSLADFRVTNLTTGKSLTALPVPPNLLKLMRGGGIYPVLEREGLIAPKAKIAKVATGH